MRAHRGVFCTGGALLRAGTLSVLLTLGGCGGGGGGGPAPADAFVYPPSLVGAGPGDTVGGFVAPYALDPVAPEIRSIQLSIFGTGAAGGEIAITVAAIELPDLLSEPAFIVTFNPASAASALVTPSPIGNLIGNLSTVAPLCGDCLRTQTVPAGGSTVTFTYLDPARFPLQYSTLGMWSKPTTVGPTSWTEVGGPFSAGVLTRSVDLPTTTTATYDGYFIGRFATSDLTLGYPAVGTYLVGANAHADVDFTGAGAVTISTSNSNRSMELGGGLLGNPVADSRLDLTSTPMPIDRASTTNSFAGTVQSSDQVNGFFTSPPSAEIKGGFYGPPASTTPFAPPELGGSLAVSNPTQSLVGSFGLKR